MARLWRATILIGAVALIAGLVGSVARRGTPAAEAARAPAVTYGRSVALGQGTARSYVLRDSRQRPAQIGVEFTPAALTGLGERDREFVLPMPAGASVAPYHHIVVNWNPHGHAPVQVYGAPHFDFHFYMITPAQRARITATGADLARTVKAPPAGYLPKGYVTAPGAAEPRMGNHWVSQASPEFHGKPFTYTFIYGSYNGHVTFLEPMATMAFLQTKPEITAPVSQPQKYPKAGYFPMQYGVRYLPGSDVNHVSLDKLTYRKAAR